MIIAIDGPAGSGKTTVAKLLAKKLRILYLDTGATYRALTLQALEENIDLSDREKLAQMARDLPLVMTEDKIFLGKRDVSKEIRTPLIDKNISLIVSYSQVREVMVALQRNIARTGDFVVEGRDITTVVFPHAEYKFFLDADFSIRAKRRFQELQQKGMTVELEAVSRELNRRDHADMTRSVGPLVKSPDAILIDTTLLNIDQMVDTLARYVSQGRLSKNKCS